RQIIIDLDLRRIKEMVESKKTRGMKKEEEPLKIKYEHKNPPKLMRALELAREITARGEKVLIFSRYNHVVRRLNRMMAQDTELNPHAAKLKALRQAVEKEDASAAKIFNRFKQGFKSPRPEVEAALQNVELVFESK